MTREDATCDWPLMEYRDGTWVEVPRQSIEIVQSAWGTSGFRHDGEIIGRAHTDGAALAQAPDFLLGAYQR